MSQVLNTGSSNKAVPVEGASREQGIIGRERERERGPDGLLAFVSYKKLSTEDEEELVFIGCLMYGPL